MNEQKPRRVLLYDAQGNAVSHEDGAAEQCEDMLGATTGSPHAMSSPEPQSSAERKWYQWFQKRENRKESLEWLMCGIAIAGGIFYFLQLKANRNQVSAALSQMEVMKRQLDDSEAQQRAWLAIEGFDIKRNTNAANRHPDGMYSVDLIFTLKNYGGTPAIDIGIGGISMSDMYEKITTERHWTNALHRWSGTNRVPDPRFGGTSIMSQQAEVENAYNYTNQVGGWYNGDGFYIEEWVSYRDIFGHSWVIGAGGHYDANTDTFTRQLRYDQQYHEPEQTDK